MNITRIRTDADHRKLPDRIWIVHSGKGSRSAEYLAF